MTSADQEQRNFWGKLSANLAALRKPRNFFFYILPFSIVLGRLIPPSASSVFNDIGVALVQIIAFPAIPLVLSAVMISISNIFSLSERSGEERLLFSSRFIGSLIIFLLFAAFLALLLSLYQAPGVLSPQAKLSIGSYMLDVTDIHVGAASIAETTVNNLWINKIIPSNILADASAGQTLKVISGSVLAGIAISRLRRDLTQPVISLLRSINTVSVQLLNIVLDLAPLVLVCLITGAVSTINAEIIVALLNLSICVFLTAVVSLGISRLVFRRFTSSAERAGLVGNPVDSIFLLCLSTGSSMSAYPLMFETLKGMGRSESEVEASSSLSLLIARFGNVTYNVIAIVFALNLYEVALTPVRLVEIATLGIFTGISAAGLSGVATVPTIGFALLYFQVPIPPVLVLLRAIDPILTLPRAATTGVLAMAISVIASMRSSSLAGERKADLDMESTTNSSGESISESM